MSAGKGDKPRPINKKEFDNNFDKIEWSDRKKLELKTQRKGKKTYVYK